MFLHLWLSRLGRDSSAGYSLWGGLVQKLSVRGTRPRLGALLNSRVQQILSGTHDWGGPPVLRVPGAWRGEQSATTLTIVLGPCGCVMATPVERGGPKAWTSRIFCERIPRFAPFFSPFCLKIA